MTFKAIEKTISFIGYKTETRISEAETKRICFIW